MADASAIALDEEVRAALADGRPVVALESTVISHGLPRPDNVDTALAMQAAIRAEGAVPATVAILDGRIRVGLSETEIARFAEASDVAKVSRRDFGWVLAGGGLGATTVSGTMIAAQAAGIDIFATGGIGGAHRGAEASFDISADLIELGRTPVMVVCAGAKSILDLARTLEILETQGVPVLGWRTDTFPAFHARDSGLALSARVDTPDAAASAARAHWALGLGGLILANPIPAEAAIAPETLEAWIAQVLDAAARDGIAGKAVTPYLLARLADLSGGRTLLANKALLIDNARVAGCVAAAHARLDRG